MLLVLLLQQWYSLSEPELEEALSDRLSLRRFVGLSLEEEVPDHSTLSRYRQQTPRAVWSTIDVPFLRILSARACKAGRR
jgi:IS5 family transposase